MPTYSGEAPQKDHERANRLTRRQRAVLDWIQKNHEERGYPPSQREIAAHFGLVGTRGVEKHLAALERKGFLRKGSGARALDLRGRAYGRNVPIVGSVAAGQPILAVENILGSLTLDSVMARAAGSFLLKVKGASMKLAGILDGDLVLIRPQPNADSGEIVVALVDGEATVKRLLKYPGKVVLQPENPDFKPLTVEREDALQIVGKVVGVFRF